MSCQISTLWKKLKTVQRVSLRCEMETLWQGFANVLTVFETEQEIIFHEKGIWVNQNLSFTNILRWRLTPFGLSLEHLRFGLHAPVFLFYLIPVKINCLTSGNPHLCGRDQYSAEIFWDQTGIHFSWSVQGPMKNHKIFSHYDSS
jgi:hypothetical protein